MKSLLFFLCICCCYTASAQLQGQALIDSLDAALPHMQEDSFKVKAYGKITQTYYSVNPDKCFVYAEKGLKLAEKIGWKQGMANMHNNLGLFISDTGNYTLGKEHYEKSLALNKETGSKLNQINNLNNIGRNYIAQSDFTTALKYFIQALSVAESLKSDEHIALVGTNLTSCFFRQNNYAKATEYAAMTIDHAKRANNSRHLINGLMQMGAIRLALKDTSGAALQLEMALKKCEETGNMSDMAKVLLNLAVTKLPDHKSSIALMLRADSIANEINPDPGLFMNNNFNLADSYFQLAIKSSGVERENHLKNATVRLNKAREIAEELSPEFMLNILKLQSDLYEESGDFKGAFASLKRSTLISDSLYSQEKKNEIAGLEGKYKLALKDNEIAISKLMLANQRKAQWGLIAGVVFLVIIGALLFWQSSTRKKTNTTLMVLNNQLDEANKVKARFFGILSHDLRSPIVNLSHFLELQKDNPDLFSEEEQVMHRKEISDSTENLLNTMEAMLLWSKEQMDNFKPNMQSVAVADLFEYIHNFFGQHDHIVMSYTAEPGLVVIADENYLRTIMQNLTSNAIRALKNRSNAQIEWKAIKEARGVVLSVTDNGPGIAAAQAKALFDSGTVANEKTGFGFHLVRDLAKAIHYTISVQSEPGKGTTFVLTS